MQILFKNKPRLGNSFYLKDWILNNVTCGAGYKFESVRHLNVRTGKQTDISPLPKNKLSQRTDPQRVIHYFATIQNPVKVLLF